MKVDREELKARIRMLSPDRKKALLRTLMEFAYGEDDVLSMPIEQVEAELREAGYTDEDFARMSRRIDEIIERFHPAPPQPEDPTEAP